VARFWQHAQGYYRKPDGTMTCEVDNFRQALRPLRQLYGETAAKDFTPLALKAVRQAMIDRGWARTNINRMVSRIKLMFRWASENSLVPPEVHYGIQSVSGLKRGRCEAKESEPVKPVLQTHINAVQPYVSRQVWALIQFQLHTGARSGELVGIRAIDIDMGQVVWTYTPKDHKTAHHGHERTIYIGPKAQAIIKEFMVGRPLDAHLLSPREPVAEQVAQVSTHRRQNQKPNPRKTARVVGDFYTTDSYRRAIQRACDKAGIPRWHPHQLRHNAATFIRKEYGIEAAQLILGHRRAEVTQVYAETNREKAIEVASKIG